jgi:hypothetical protein
VEKSSKGGKSKKYIMMEKIFKHKKRYKYMENRRGKFFLMEFVFYSKGGYFKK